LFVFFNILRQLALNSRPASVWKASVKVIDREFVTLAKNFREF